MDLDLISIIVPTFNCAAYISDTIESVLVQTYREWEIFYWCIKKLCDMVCA